MDPFKTLIIGTPPSRTYTGSATGLLTSANNLSDVADGATAFTNIKQAASTSATGVIEIATQAEATAGTSSSLAITPATLNGVVSASTNTRAPAQGLVFDGTAGATHSNITLGSGDFTVAVWARVSTTSAANRQLIGSSAGDTAFFLDTTGLAKIYISGQSTYTASSVVPDQKSVLIVYTKSGSSGTFYQNAVSNGTVTDSNNYSTAWSHFGSRSGGGYTTGTLIPLIYNRALSAAEVVALYEAGTYKAISTTGLLLAPDAAQAGGGLVWYDTSGNAANITLPASGVSWNVPSSRVLGGNWTTSGNATVGDLILGTSGPSAKSSIAARAARQGLVFDGTAGSTLIGPSFGTSDFTVALWLNPAAIAQKAILVGTNINMGHRSSGAFYTNAGDLGGAVLVAGKMQLVVYSRSGTTGSYYIDGVAQATQTDSFNYGQLTNIGTTNQYAGFVLPFLYNRALSAAEVKALYEAGAPSAADYNGASNTSKLTGANSDFSSAGNWTVTGATTISGGKLNLSNGDQAYCTPGNISVPVGARFRVTLTVDSITAGSVQVYTGGTGGWVNIATTAGTFTQEFTFSAASGPNPSLNLKSTGGNAVVDTALYYQIGLLLAPDAAQAGGGLVWYDTSGNAANITLPASGVSWNVPSSRVLGGNWTTSGNLTVSGTGKNIFNSGGGNLLIGTTTDGGQKLQVNGTASFTGAIAIGNTVQTASSVASTHKVTISIGGVTYYLLATNV